MEEGAHHSVRLLFSSMFLFYSFVPGQGLIHETRMHINTGYTIRKGSPLGTLRSWQYRLLQHAVCWFPEKSFARTMLPTSTEGSHNADILGTGQLEAALPRQLHWLPVSRESDTLRVITATTPLHPFYFLRTRSTVTFFGLKAWISLPDYVR